jgi:hypothetical protein
MKYIKQFLLSVTLLLVGTVAPAQSCVTTNDVTTCHYTIPDDGHAIIPIPFGFPYYGRVFTHSIMFDNGIVSFYTPNQYPQYFGGQQFFAQPLSGNMGSQFSYSIMPLWTDLVNYSGSHFTVTDGVSFLRYNWENISQWGNPSNLNTFSAEITPGGSIGFQYQQVNISGYPVTIGMTGDLSLGEFTQHYHQPNGGATTINNLQSWSVIETVAFDCSDPIVNVNCPGYQQAFFDQQCSQNALYSPACPGYADAYNLWQISVCTVDPLAFYGQCETIAPTVWFNYQCSLDPLYDKDCSGYAEAFALKYIIGQDTETTIESETENVDSSVTETTQTASTSPADSSTAAVSLTTQPATTPQPAATTSTRTEPAARTTPTARQALAQRRAAAAAAQAAQRAKDNPEGTSEAMDSADSMEQQVELQNAVVGAMSFVPGFDAYGRVTLPDAPGYAPFEIYSGQRNVDTPAARGLLGRSDRLHQEMIDAQYR